MRRQNFMAVLACAAAYPLAAGAQQKVMPVIGYLAFGSPGLAPTAGVFLQGLSETGYVEGQNVAISRTGRLSL
jgi:putative ABC transport system substrate-binding protein